MAKAENIDREVSKKRVEDYVKKVNQSFETHKSFIIENFGSLVKEETGKINFLEYSST